MALESPVQRDGDAGFIGFASRLNPLTLPAGMLQDSVNMRLDRGVAQTRKGAKRLADDIVTTDDPLTLSFSLAADKSVTSIAWDVVTGLATATVSSHGYSTGNTVNIRGATQSAYNGDFIITVTGTNTFTYSVTGSPTTPATGTIIANKGPLVKNSYTGGIFAAGVFASQNYQNAAEYIVLAGASAAFLWRQGVSSATKSYPSSPDETIEATDTVSIVQAFDRLYILREADRTVSGWGEQTRNVTAGTCTISNASPAVVTKTAHGLENGMAVVFSTTGSLPTGLTAGTVYYVVNKATDTFQVSATSGGSAINTSSAGSGTHTMTPVSAVVSGTAATIFSKNHGYVVGNRVRLTDGTAAAFDGHEYDIATKTDHTFTVTVPSGTANDTTAGLVLRRVKAPLYWDGGSGDFIRASAGVPSQGVTYTRMPSVGWASYINNRLWLAKNRDTVAISDVLDADLYDPFWNSFRAGAGGDDRIVAIHPWVENSALVFCRKSIWLAKLGQFASTDGSDFSVDAPVSELTLLTDEIGCSARNTIATAGAFVFFLSDAGIYRLDSRLDLKLRGDTKPLSDPIADLFQTIDQSKAHRAFGIWHNNRYVVAIPTTAATDDTNNLVVAWNSLNDQWEHRDSYTIGVDQLLVGTYSNERRLFNSRRTGKLWLLDENNSGADDNTTAGADGTNVTGTIKTRRYDFKDPHSKRFLRTIADVVIPNGATVTTKVNIINPDRVNEQIGTLTNSTGSSEDYNLKSPIRFKAHAAEIIYETTGGRPEIRSASIEASPKSLPPTETRNAA